MYQSIFCASSVDIYIEFFCYEYLWDLKLSLVYMHNAGLMSRQTTEQRGNSLFKPPIYWGRPTFSFIVMKLGKCKLKRSRSKIDKMQNIQLRSVANRVMTFLAKQLAIFITSSNSRCHYVEDLMLLWELVSLRRGSVIYLGLSQGQPAIRYIYTISTLC